MTDYNSAYTGLQIDEGIGKALTAVQAGILTQSDVDNALSLT